VRFDSLWAALTRRNPVVVLRRAARRFARRPRAMQLRTIAVAVGTVVGLVIYVAGAPDGGSSGPTIPGTKPGSSLRPPATATGPHLVADVTSTPAAGTPVDQASTSTRGISGKTINVAFPIANLSGLAGAIGFASDVEFSEQTKAIHLYVNEINSHGGINGRKINPLITNFDPTNEASTRALCKDWTEGSPAAFAVLDGLGDWIGPDQLCITQEGQTPFIGAWSTVTNWTTLGSPYLWWTGPDQAAILATTVQWGQSAGLLSGSRKVGIIVGDRASDQLALNQYLLPDLRNAGITPASVQTIAAGVSSTAQTNAQAPLVIQKLRSAGVNSVIPVVPFNVFFPVLLAENQQSYFPKLLLSDYESSITSALGLIPTPDESSLDGQRGVTTLTLGGFDDDRPESQGGYDPGLRSCYQTWHAAYPKPPKGAESAFIEEQGPVAGWCQEIRLFAQAARAAGPNLNRRTFVQAMAGITNFPGTWSPTLSFGPNKFYGPTQYQVVSLHNNVPPSSQCKLKTNHKPQGTCWVTQQPFQPLAALSPG
jgi:Periplasmic binding protein